MALPTNRFELQKNAWGGECPDDLTVDELVEFLFSVSMILEEKEKTYETIKDTFEMVANAKNFAPSVYKLYLLVKNHFLPDDMIFIDDEKKAIEAFKLVFV